MSSPIPRLGNGTETRLGNGTETRLGNGTETRIILQYYIFIPFQS